MATQTQAIPPIQARATYPPSQPSLGSAPALLGHAPQSLSQVMFPGTAEGTQFQGPLLSGPTPGINGAVGSARLSMAIQVDGSMGNYNLQIPFPGGSFLLGIDAITLATGLNAMIILGTQTGQGDIATVALPALGAFAPTEVPSVQLPLWNAVAPQAPFTAWMNVSANGTKNAGIALVLLNYVRIAGPWSVPGVNYNTP